MGIFSLEAPPAPGPTGSRPPRPAGPAKPADRDRSSNPAGRGATSSDPAASASGAGRALLWRRSRVAGSLGLLVVVGVLTGLQSGSLRSGLSRLGRLQSQWLVLAVGAEIGSMVTFAVLQRRLLRAGRADIRLSTMVSITLAANALTGTLPGGVGWAAAWQFDQLGRRGVDRLLRVWTFLVAGAVSSFALFVVIALGVELAGGAGPVAPLRWWALLLAAIPVLALALWSLRRTELVHALGTRSQGWSDVPVFGWVVRASVRLRQELATIRLSPLGWVVVLGLALCNWLFDCVVVVAVLRALNIAVPWSAILVIYGLTQVSASIPITPGGLGVVAGSLTALLHAYGVPMDAALAGSILYRIVSFWILVPLGWMVWAALEWTTRHHLPVAGRRGGAVGAGAGGGAVGAGGAGVHRQATGGGRVAGGRVEVGRVAGGRVDPEAPPALGTGTDG